MDTLEDLRRRAAGEGKLLVPENYILARASVELTVKELREALDANPNHHKVKAFRLGIQDLEDYRKIRVEADDLQGLIENRKVFKYFDDQGIRRKKLEEVSSPEKISKPYPPVSSPLEDAES